MAKRSPATRNVSPAWTRARTRLPALVERLEAFRDAVGGRRNLIGVDRVELLLLAENLEIPEDQRFAPDDAGRHRRIGRLRGSGD